MQQLRPAITRLLRPLARLLIARGVPFPKFLDWAKEAYLTAAERHFRVPGKRLTDSRLHLLTGLQRKDIKALRAEATNPPPMTAGPLSRVVARWLAEHVKDGKPVAMARTGPAPSFEALVAEVSRDVHSRTILDELIRLGHAEADGQSVRLTTDAFLPSADDSALLGYLGANVSDHAEAATANVLAAPDPGPHFERAAHYNNLTPAAVTELDRLSRKLLGDALSSINARAAALQKRDRGTSQATHRFRAGAYVYAEDEAGEDAQ